MTHQVAPVLALVGSAPDAVAISGQRQGAALFLKARELCMPTCNSSQLQLRGLISCGAA